MSEFSTAGTGINVSFEGAAEVSPGLENAYSFANISPEEADAINNGVEIVIYGMTHAMTDSSNTDPTYLAGVEAQYQDLADMVDGLDPVRGDVLYMESAMHTGAWELMDRSWDDATHAQHLETRRADRTIHPYTYATERAALRGVPVKVADMHRHVADEFEFVTGESARAIARDKANPLCPAYAWSG
jgi:hypothetical protein